MGEVVTALLNAHPDPQRGTTLDADPALFAALADSLAVRGHRLTVLSDCLPTGQAGNVTTIQVRAGANPYFHRWAVIARYLDACTMAQVWCVDATDVTMVGDPFHEMTDALHIGSEDSIVGSSWMRATHHSLIRVWVATNAGRRLLNPGVVGGRRDAVRTFAAEVASLEGEADMTDMAAANKVAYELFPGHVTGHPVHTPYKAFTRVPGAWWMHK